MCMYIYIYICVCVCVCLYVHDVLALVTYWSFPGSNPACLARGARRFGEGAGV